MIPNCFHDSDATVGAWVLGILDPRDLPDFATALLVRGLDGRYLRELAGLLPVDVAEADRLFREAIQELRWSIPDRGTAARSYARCISRFILNGEITPYEGAQALAEASIEVRDKTFHELDPFIYTSSEYRDRPQDRAMFDAAIVDAAKRWVR